MTHWHLVVNDWANYDRLRFDNERTAAERAAPPVEVARTPAEVAEWVTSTRKMLIERHRLTEAMLLSSGLATAGDWERKESVALHIASCGLDVCALLAIGRNRIVHINAYVVTTDCC